VVKLSDEEFEDLTARAAEAGMTVPRLLVETTLGKSVPESGRAGAVAAVLELEGEVRRVGANLNQLTRYSHQDRELAEGIVWAAAAGERACLALDAVARRVVGRAPAVARRVGGSVNQWAGYAQQDRELAEGVEWAAAGVVRGCLSLDAVARWVMGMAPAVSPMVVGEEALAAAQAWSEQVDDLGVDESGESGGV